ncbi:rapamycin-insensitive companion of mTOR-like isoform X1 [Astyanax mexicanus]|uniref:Rapamycin-insensitive companion of mTOR-like isoform X1 n=1 Tax=Astyanax mexicanus TaxID=7994 RepID=A0A8T2KX67_ASTMX|nr:rapamycin-insensitive companion of mTOR-like isoform X1 [Astyanax mexicanus]
MALSVRGRPSRSARLRGRNDSGEENVPLDLSREPSENMREILQNVSKSHGVSNMRKLGHLNNFIKLLNSVGHHEEKFGFTYEEIIICLRLALLNEVKEVRAAGLRAFRYLIRDKAVLQKLLQLQVDYLISRCIDIQQSNEVERTQALRLLRKIIAVDAALFPGSVTNSLVAVGNDGLHEGDRMVLACNAIICELALRNPEVVAGRGGLSTLLKNVLDSQQSRINEALITTVLHLLNHPHTRQYVRSDVELEQILAPYTDFHYRHNPDTTEAQLKKDREARFLASKMAIVASFRSWSGIINLCKAGNSGIQSLIGLLCIPNMEIRKALLEVLYEIFRLPVPMVTTDFEEALQSIDPSRLQDSWRLGDGFVAAEAKVILPHRTRSRPDLMDNYLALILSTLINSGLLEGLVEVVTSSDDDLSVRATILLGELLHMASSLLPHSHSHHLHCLPTLINMAASFDIPPEKRLRASAAVNQLKRLHELKKRSPKPHSLYLQLILQQSSHTHTHRSHRDTQSSKDTEDALIMNLRDSQILNHKQNLDWNWVLISTVLKWPNTNLRNNRDEQIHKFVRRLLYFYKPSSKLYCGLDLEHPKASQLTTAGCLLVQFLLESEEEGQVYLEDLVKDIVTWLISCSGLKSERSLQSNGLLSTLSQHYFLFLGTLSAQPLGVKTMEKCGVFQCLLSLCSLKNQDALLKLTVSTLDYSRDGLARVILSKILTAGSDVCRLYATKHLRVLLRANVEFFSNWGIELLAIQLHDLSKVVSMEALDILDEACEEKANLHALIHMKPALTHLGDKGLLLQLRFLSIPKGFSYLNERGYVSKQLEKWSKEYNLKYVDMVEELMNEALTTYRKPVDGDNYVRRTNQRLQRPNVYLPVHLYGQLVHDKTGCLLLEAQNVVPDLSYTVRSPVLDTCEGIKQLKAALWALGNIGSSNWGVNLLQEENIISDIITLAQHCEVLSIRGVCVYVLGVISRTRQGSEVLKVLGWDSVRHGRRQQWPVVEEPEARLPGELSSIPSTLSLNSESNSSQRESESESQPSLYFVDDECDGVERCEDVSPVARSKPVKDRSPFTLLASSRLVRNRFLNSLPLPSMKPRSTSDPKHSGGGKKSPEELQPGAVRRNRTLTAPSSYSPGRAAQGEVFYNGGRSPHSPGISLETSFINAKTLQDGYAGGDGSDTEVRAFPNCVRGLELEFRGQRKMMTLDEVSDVEIKGQRKVVTVEEGQRERRACDSSSTGLPGGAVALKSRSQSFNTDTTTSGISSMSSSPSRETASAVTVDTDCGSISTVVSTSVGKTDTGGGVSLVPPGSAHTLPRRAVSLRSPASVKSLVDCSVFSPRDALGYATLRRLQQQRIHPSLSHSEALTSPAKDVLFTDAITMKTRSLDSRLHASRSRFLKALSFVSLDKEDLLSPINHSTLHRSASLRSMVSSATYGCTDDYIGVALPGDVTDLFHINENSYFQKRTSPPVAEKSVFFGDSDGLMDSCRAALKQRVSITELLSSTRSEQRRLLGGEESTGLQQHNNQNCLYCSAMLTLGEHTHTPLNNVYLRTDLSDGFSHWQPKPSHTHLEVLTQSKFSGVSGCSDAAVSQGSTSSTPSTEILLGGKGISEDGPACRVLLRKEIVRLVINLSSSVGNKGNETGLLTIKEKFPCAFDDACLYSEVSFLLSSCRFRLASRRFIQELFQDVQFIPLYNQAEAVLSKPVRAARDETPAES